MKIKGSLINKVGGIDSEKMGKLIWCAGCQTFSPEERVELVDGFPYCMGCRISKKYDRKTKNN